MATLHSISVRVVAVSVDNAAVNRKFYGDYLCNGSLSTHIIDSVTGQPIYLLFDPVHNLKNIYNNFLARKVFVCPPRPKIYQTDAVPTLMTSLRCTTWRQQCR